MRYEFELALRYLRARRKGPVSLITAITIGGVAMGVTALTVVTSVWNGFESEFLDKLLGIKAHALVLRSHGVFSDYESVQGNLEAQPEIVTASPFAYSEVIVQSPTGSSGVAIKGVNGAHASKTPLAEYADPQLLAQMSQRTTGLPGVLVGKALAENLRLKPGDIMTAISASGSIHRPDRADLRVLGTFHSGMHEFDSRMVFIDLKVAQKLFRLHNTVTGMEVWTTDPLKSRRLVRRAMDKISTTDPLAFDVQDWSQTQQGLFGAVKQQKMLITLVLAFIIVVAAFNIVATLILLILEKAREIAVLKSLGAQNRSILAIFIIDGQIIGLLGCALGVGLGLAICFVLEAYGLKLDPRVYYLENLPIVVRPLEVTLAAVGAMVAATIATVYPAYQAARLSPVDGLRKAGLTTEATAPRR